LKRISSCGREIAAGTGALVAVIALSLAAAAAGHGLAIRLNRAMH
jgi:hypothetical protein